jgi:uncharacterized protein (DUF58 family)
VSAPLLGPEDLRKVSDLALVARWVVEGTITGLHRSPHHGFSIEFAEYREYVPGDDLRYFDWKVLGRSDRRTIKKFHSETNLHAHIVVDSSASMGYGDPTKFHYARCLAAAIAYVLEGQKDGVGLVLVDDGVRLRLPPAVGPTQLRRIFGALEEAAPASKTSLAAALDDIAGALGRRGLVAIISDLHDDEEALRGAVRHLRFAGHEVIVFHVLDPSELRIDVDRPVEFEDLETGERLQVHGATIREGYERRVREWIDALRAGIEGSRADYRLVETTEPFAAVLSDYLHGRRARGAGP